MSHFFRFLLLRKIIPTIVTLLTKASFPADDNARWNVLKIGIKTKSKVYTEVDLCKSDKWFPQSICRDLAVVQC